MAQPFSPQQRDAIREKLKESARKYAVSTGVKKTSLDMLTADAGLSLIHISLFKTDFQSRRWGRFPHTARNADSASER